MFQSWSWDRARVEARQAGEAMGVWGGMGGKQTREWLGGKDDEQSRAGQNRTNARRGGRGEKQNPPRLDNTPPANLDYPNCTVCRSVCVSGECVCGVRVRSLFPIDYITPPSHLS